MQQPDPAVQVETERLLLRQVSLADAPGMLALDSDVAVLRYVPNQPIRTLAEATAIVVYIQQQYQHNGIGRWAVVRKDTREFIGWCGIKLVNDSEMDGRTNYYDIGYRLLPAHWGQGYASEAAGACLRYALEEMQLPEVLATVMQANQASCKVLEKIGLIRTATFTETDGSVWLWYRKSNQPD